MTSGNFDIEVGDVLLNKDTHPKVNSADYANKVRRYMAYPNFEPPVIFGPGIQITPKVNDAEFLQNLEKYRNGEIQCFIVPHGATYKMSVANQADEKLAQAKESVRHALKQLNDIVILECEGHSDFSESYLEKITDAHTMLIEVRRKLG